MNRALSDYVPVMEESVHDVAYRPGPGLVEKDRPVTSPDEGRTRNNPLANTTYGMVSATHVQVTGRPCWYLSTVQMKQPWGYDHVWECHTT